MAAPIPERPERRPDLLARAGAAAGGKSILAQLEHGMAAAAPATPQRPPSRQPPWRTATAAVLAAMLAVPLTIALLPALQPGSTAPAVIAGSTATPAGTLQGAAAAMAHATIMTPPALAAAPAAAPAQPVTARPAAVTSAPAPRRVAPVPVRSRPAADSDVTLLAAMVAHGHAAAPAARASADSAIRQRCQQADQVEAMLCRARVCSAHGSGEPVSGLANAPACPQP